MPTSNDRPVILVVEDDPPVRTLLRDIFVEAGYEVMLAEDGATALSAMATVMPDVMTLDLEMQGINGFQLLSALRQRPRTQSLAVVIVSAQEPSPAVRALAQAVVPKPFEIEELLAVVQRLVPPPGHKHAPAAR